jgi:hypothetical protein
VSWSLPKVSMLISPLSVGVIRYQSVAPIETQEGCGSSASSVASRLLSDAFSGKEEMT